MFLITQTSSLAFGAPIRQTSDGKTPQGRTDFTHVIVRRHLKDVNTANFKFRGINIEELRAHDFLHFRRIINVHDLPRTQTHAT